MRNNTFQKRVTTSAATLLFSAVACAILWALPGGYDLPRLIGLLATAVTTYFMVEWNNTYSLMRVRSRMLSSVFLMLQGACPMLHDWSTDMGVALSLLLCYFFLFRSYQKVRAEADYFHAFAFLGVGCLWFPQLLYFVPFLWLAGLVQLRSLGWRSFVASLLGLMLPYWAYAGYAVWYNRLDLTWLHFERLLTWQTPDYRALSVQQVLTAAFVVGAALISVFHYLRTAYNDRIRTRMFLNLLVLQEVLLLAFFISQPQHFHLLLLLLLVNSSPLIAHYLTLARGRFMNAWFVCVLIAYGAFAVLVRLNLESWKLW